MTNRSDVYIPQSFTGIGKVREYLMNPERQSEVFADIADGVALTEIAHMMNVRYSDLYRVLGTDFADDYQAAREAYANYLAERNLSMADQVETRELPPEAANSAAKLRQWHMEKVAPEQWGQKSTVNMNVKQVAELHMKAVRDLSREDPAGSIEGEYEEVEYEFIELGDHANDREENDIPNEDNHGDDLPGSHLL